MGSLGFCLINSLIQSYVGCYSIENCLKESTKINKRRFFLLFIIFCCSNFDLITSIQVFSNSIIIIHLVNLSAVAVIYNKKLKNAVSLYSFFYYLHIVYSLVCATVASTSMDYISRIKYLIISMVILGLYFSISTMFRKTYLKIINNKRQVPSIIIGSIMIDFLVMFYINLMSNDNKKMMYLTAIFFIVFILIIGFYLRNIYLNSITVYNLNKTLEQRNIELKDIKNSHANIIFYLENLYKNGNINEGGNLLKKIINKEENELKIIKHNNLENYSMIKTALSRAINLGIDVEIKEKCDIFCADINEIELYRIIVNIINNAIKAMDSKGKIGVNTYYQNKNNVVITIGNNGPKIDDDTVKKIFKAGFTTKENTEKNHGYGLSIVKELIESSKGKITVNSTDEWTEFKIILPKRNAI